MIVKTDCRFYRGDIPCRPHKQHGVHCENCSYHENVDQRILIIKLGAVGDVIRTTPLLRKLKQQYPQSEIHWLTSSPEVLPSLVDHKLCYDWKTALVLHSTPFDLVINLDKDLDACALAKLIDAPAKKGYLLEKGRVVPATSEAEAKWLTGLFDDVNRSNTKSYPQEIFEICGFQYSGESYVLDPPQIPSPWVRKDPKMVIGLNTGCGKRWQTRLWPDGRWVELAKRLREQGLEVLILGGEQEHGRNQAIAFESGAVYPGYFPLKQFIALMNQCDLVVTTVTMGLHIAIGLGKKVVLFNNIFNCHEFELYGHGIILEPDVPCKGCYKSSYDESCPAHCMELIGLDEVEKSCLNLLR